MQTGGCPFNQGKNSINTIADEFRPFDINDPFPFYKKARHEQPVFYNEELGYYIISRFEDVKAIFKNWKAFSSQNAQVPVRPVCAQAKELMDAAGMSGLSGLSGRVAPDHTRIRRIVSMAFGLKRVRAMEPGIRELAIDMISGFAADGHADLVRQLAYDLPAMVIFMLLGIPNKDVPKVKDWAISRMLLTWGNLTDEEQVIHAQNMIRYWDYCQLLVAARQLLPGDDLPGDLVKLQHEGHEISDREIATICYSMLFAGHETTTSLIANGIRELLTYRESWEQIRLKPELIPNAIEEILRFSGSIVAWRRRSMEDVVVGGIPIAKDSNILLLMGSANRDDENFPDGETFDIMRENAAEHLSFGNGIHFCLGSPLAKLELKTVLEELIKRIPDMRLRAGQQYDFAINTSFRAPLALYTEW